MQVFTANVGLEVGLELFAELRARSCKEEPSLEV